MRILLLTTLILALAGCASSGPPIANDQLAGLQKGKTTRDDIVRRFGSPSFHSDNMDGTKTSAYLQAGTRSSASALIALTAAIASGTRANVNSVIFRFDENGVMSSYERTVESPSAEPQTARTETGGIPPAAPTNAPASSAPLSTAPVPAPATPPRPARQDNLPDWLPSSSTKDPRAM